MGFFGRIVTWFLEAEREPTSEPQPGTVADTDLILCRLTALSGQVSRQITELFAAQKIGSGLIVPEVFAFGMGVATEVCQLYLGDRKKSDPILDRFHTSMGMAFGEQFLREQNIAPDPGQIVTAHDLLMDLLRIRYPLYREAYRADVLLPNSIWRQTSTLLLTFLPAERLPPATVETFLVPVGLSAAACYTFGLRYLSEMSPKNE